MKLFVDDRRTPPDDTWTLVKTYQDALPIIDSEVVEELALDNDLGIESFRYVEGHMVEGSGYDLLMHVVQMKMDGKKVPSKITVHSANPVMNQKMREVIERYLND